MYGAVYVPTYYTVLLDRPTAMGHCHRRGAARAVRGACQGGRGDINIHIDVNMNTDMHLIIKIKIDTYIIGYSILAIPYEPF